MTAFYVFAVTDAAPKTAGRGLGGPLVLRPIAGVYVALERRADVPPVELGTLKRHHQTVERIAGKSSPTRSTSFAAGAK